MSDRYGLHLINVTFMPRYFFNTQIGKDLIPDPEGEELRDPDQAWEVARALILRLLEEQGEHHSLLTASVEVVGADGEMVLEFPFAEAMMEGKEESPTTH